LQEFKNGYLSVESVARVGNVYLKSEATVCIVECSERLGDAYEHKTANSNNIPDLDRPSGFQEVEATRFYDTRRMKMVRLSALRIGRLHDSGDILGTNLC
jgi:hypothetical protein